MYEYQLSRHLAHEHQMEMRRFAEEGRLIAEAEKLQPRKNRHLHFSGISRLLRGLLSGSHGIVRPGAGSVAAKSAQLPDPRRG